MSAGRHLAYYESGPLLFDTSHPVLKLDAHGALARVQYHESYRTASTLPYGVCGKLRTVGVSTVWFRFS